MARKGSTPLAMVVTGLSVIPEATKRLRPKGGVSIPIWIQNAGVVPLWAEQVVKLCTELEHVSWVKEEVQPETHSISNLLGRQCPHVKGVMGGGGGRYMITEHARGS